MKKNKRKRKDREREKGSQTDSKQDWTRDRRKELSKLKHVFVVEPRLKK
jgi:hypothetical protein